MKRRKEGKQMEEVNTKDELWLFHSHQTVSSHLPIETRHQREACCDVYSSSHVFQSCPFQLVLEIFLHQPEILQCSWVLQGCGSPSNISQCIHELSMFPVCSVIDLLGWLWLDHSFTSYVSMMQMIQTSNTLCLFIITLKTNYSCNYLFNTCLPYETMFSMRTETWSICVHLWILSP